MYNHRRAQWVCSRERRIALYKWSSINQSKKQPRDLSDAGQHNTSRPPSRSPYTAALSQTTGWSRVHFKNEIKTHTKKEHQERKQIGGKKKAKKRRKRNGSRKRRRRRWRRQMDREGEEEGQKKHKGKKKRKKNTHTKNEQLIPWVHACGYDTVMPMTSSLARAHFHTRCQKVNGQRVMVRRGK